MLSKAATIGILVLLTTSLIGGSAYILLRPDPDSVTARNERLNAAAGQQGNRSQDLGQGQGQGGQGQEQGQGSGQGQDTPGQNGNGYQGGNGGGQGSQSAGASGSAEVEHPSDTWETLTGTVAGLEGDELTIETTETNLIVHLGPEWHWESEGIALEMGDEVNVSGFYESDTFEVGSIENLSTGESVTLRDEAGHPLWAGGGRGRSASE